MQGTHHGGHTTPPPITGRLNKEGKTLFLEDLVQHGSVGVVCCCVLSMLQHLFCIVYVHQPLYLYTHVRCLGPTTTNPPETHINQNTGRAQWLDRDKRQCLILYKTYDEWASLLRSWAEGQGLSDEVVLLDDLHSGQEVQGTGMESVFSCVFCVCFVFLYVFLCLVVV